MKKILSFISVFLLLFSFVSCEKEPIKNGGPKTEKIEVKLEAGMDYCGVVIDTDGKPISGVTVSDGYSCTTTNDKGIYQLKANEYSYHVFISIPSKYQVPMDSGLPCFWKKIEKTQSRYDFVLAPLAKAESKFYLLCLADPQCQNQTRHIPRFENESIPDIKATAVELSKVAPVYGITLGDIGYNDASNDHNQRNGIFPRIKGAMHVDKIGAPIFQVMGNHDNKLLSAASYNIAQDIEAQRNFEYAFGPVNYSFNRGNAHIIAMDNILFRSHDSYTMGFRDDQVEWLRQNLENVPKDKMIIFCVHIPMLNSSNQNVQNVIALIEQYPECHVMAGHTHYNRNTVYPKRREHTHAAVCGAWWWSTVNCDGSPNGYGVYEINGPSITNWYYKGVGMDKDDQIRLYRGNLPYMAGQGNQYYFTYKNDNHLIANIWNYDSSWKVEVYENGVKTGEMKQMSGSGSYDAWVGGYHIGVVGRGSHYMTKSNTHMFYYELNNPSASIEVKARDGFGTVYTQNYITSNTRVDYPMAPGDPY